ncbi:MAG: class I SAM-dependent methyltransferase [Candidatus Yanofskybacteria bacterium]|nr:class I SAM-dependent methyltransferase [Candidatus Yanofskybacteria bacterium]
MDAIEKTKEYYDQNAPHWNHEKRDPMYARAVFENFTKYLVPDAYFLDIGCGVGREIPMFEAVAPRLKFDGMDISQRMLDVAHAKNPDVALYCANIVDPYLALEKTYDAFWALGVFQHIPLEYWPVLISNLQKIIKPGGFGFIALPQERNSTPEDPRHFQLFKPGDFEKLIEPAEWKIVQQGTMGQDIGNTRMWLWYIVQLP